MSCGSVSCLHASSRQSARSLSRLVRTGVAIYLYETQINLPQGQSGHLLIEVFVKDVACLCCQHIEDFNGTVAHTCCDVFVIIIETHLEARLCGVSKSVLVRNFDVAAL